MAQPLVAIALRHLAADLAFDAKMQRDVAEYAE
jgi:hypothetical protein